MRVVLVCLFGLLASIAARAEDGPGVAYFSTTNTGQTPLYQCSSKDKSQVAECNGYVQAVIDSVGRDGAIQRQCLIKVPEWLLEDQAREIVARYLAKNSDKLNRAAIVLTRDALTEALPCTK